MHTPSVGCQVRGAHAMSPTLMKSFISFRHPAPTKTVGGGTDGWCRVAFGGRYRGGGGFGGGLDLICQRPEASGAGVSASGCSGAGSQALRPGSVSRPAIGVCAPRTPTAKGSPGCARLSSRSVGGRALKSSRAGGRKQKQENGPRGPGGATRIATCLVEEML